MAAVPMYDYGMYKMPGLVFDTSPLKPEAPKPAQPLFVVAGSEPKPPSVTSFSVRQDGTGVQILASNPSAGLGYPYVIFDIKRDGTITAIGGLPDALGLKKEPGTTRCEVRKS